MKKTIYIALILSLAVSCLELRESDPYKGSLNRFTVVTEWPEGDFDREGVDIRVENINLPAEYASVTDAQGKAEFDLPDGLYRININGRSGKNILNGASDRVAVSGGDVTLKVPVNVSRPGSIVFKEIYCGGCKRLPLEGDYQTDKYVILHNNDYQVQYLDGLCFGTLSPYNAIANNPWVSNDPVTGGTVFPDFIPVIQAVWKFPGDGDDFPLQPGEDAVLVVNGAINHAAQYPLSVDLNRPDCFVCYNATSFNNTSYHPVPGDKVSMDRYMKLVVKTGISNAFIISNNSPAVIIFRPEGTTIEEHVLAAGAIVQVPGSKVDNVVKIPQDWVVDAVEVFDGRSSTNSKRLSPAMDAGYVTLSDSFQGHTLMRDTDDEATELAGYEILKDTNNSLNDFYERQIQSLHE